MKFQRVYAKQFNVFSSSEWILFKYSNSYFCTCNILEFLKEFGKDKNLARSAVGDT